MSPAGLSDLCDRYEMLGCELHHAASSSHANQSLPVAGKRTADSIQPYSHNPSNQSAVGRSDVSFVRMATNASAQSMVAAEPGAYNTISAGSSSPCVAIFPENRNPLAPRTGVQATTASLGVSSDAGDGRESSCFGDGLEFLASGDGAPSEFLNACTENDDRMIGAVPAAAAAGGLHSPNEAVEVIQNENG